MQMNRSTDEHAQTELARAAKQQRIYVKVNSDFDTTGYMQPKEIVWQNGRIYRIDRIKDFRPAVSLGTQAGGDCYTVVIGTEERHLYFERTNPLFASRVGRWYILKKADQDL